MQRSLATLFALLGLAVLAPAPLQASNDTAATPSPEAIVQAQLDAYNRHDLEAFLSFYADDAILARHPDVVTQTGKVEMRARYEKRFKTPNLHAEVLRRTVFGRFVIDHERVSAPPAQGATEAVAIYEVKDGKIVRVTFLDP